MKLATREKDSKPVTRIGARVNLKKNIGSALGDISGIPSINYPAELQSLFLTLTELLLPRLSHN
jgi:hypothetical protein